MPLLTLWYQSDAPEQYRADSPEQEPMPFQGRALVLSRAAVRRLPGLPTRKGRRPAPHKRRPASLETDDGLRRDVVLTHGPLDPGLPDGAMFQKETRRNVYQMIRSESSCSSPRDST
jgi:hypothetical protein